MVVLYLHCPIRLHDIIRKHRDKCGLNFVSAHNFKPRILNLRFYIISQTSMPQKYSIRLTKVYKVRYSSNNYICWLYETPRYETDKEQFLGKKTAISQVWGKVNFHNNSHSGVDSHQYNVCNINPGQILQLVTNQSAANDIRLSLESCIYSYLEKYFKWASVIERKLCQCVNCIQINTPRNSTSHPHILVVYRGADISLARPGKK